MRAALDTKNARRRIARSPFLLNTGGRSRALSGSFGRRLKALSRSHLKTDVHRFDHAFVSQDHHFCCVSASAPSRLDAYFLVSMRVVAGRGVPKSKKGRKSRAANFTQRERTREPAFLLATAAHRGGFLHSGSSLHRYRPPRHTRFSAAPALRPRGASSTIRWWRWRAGRNSLPAASLGCRGRRPPAPAPPIHALLRPMTPHATLAPAFPVVLLLFPCVVLGHGSLLSPLPRSSGSSCTTSARPTTLFGPESDASWS